MTDRELLLVRLERLAIVLDELMPQCAELVRDALALLKEQDNCENCAIAIEDRQPVVLCKDCKQSGIDSTSYPQYWCSAHSEYHNADWFCADGERK